MTQNEKRKQLRNHKLFATGLFVLMAVIFIATTVLQKDSQSHWLGYIRAFSEAAMVGALADWFAVSALFHYPLGLKIPHTNLIQNKKDQIGDNLGSFVVGNFLSPQTIRPYISKIKVSDFLGSWLSKPMNQELLVSEGSVLLRDVLIKLDDRAIETFITQKAREFTEKLDLASVVSGALSYVVEKDQHQLIVTSLARNVKIYISENTAQIKSRVSEQSFALIPKFVDRAIADKITQGMVQYFEEIEQDLQHPMRAVMTEKLKTFSTQLKTDANWNAELKSMQAHFFTQSRLEGYAHDLWASLKTTLLSELEKPDSALKTYLEKNLQNLSSALLSDESLKQKTDRWVRLTAYRYLLQNTHRVSQLISSTVGNWDGQELSEKLELEVGKDLQFIRVNGTLVGGLVGLILYTIANFFI